MRYLYLTFVLLFNCLLVTLTHAQVITFEKNYGYLTNDYGSSIYQTTDDNYFIICQTNSGLCVVKADSFGNTISNYFSYNIPFMSVWSGVNQTLDNGYIIAGTTGLDIYITKLNENGDSLWKKDYKSSFVAPYSIFQAFDGGYVIAGSVYQGGLDNDIFLMKADVNGDSMWTKTLGRSGFLNFEEAYAAQPTPDSGVIIVGYQYDTAISNNNSDQSNYSMVNTCVV